MAEVISLLAGGRPVQGRAKTAPKTSPKTGQVPQQQDIKAALELAMGALRASYEARITLLTQELADARASAKSAHEAAMAQNATLQARLEAAHEQAGRLQGQLELMPATPREQVAIDMTTLLEAIHAIRIPEPAPMPAPPAYSLTPTGRDPNGRPLGYTLIPIKEQT